MSPALAGSFFSTEPPGKPLLGLLLGINQLICIKCLEHFKWHIQHLLAGGIPLAVSSLLGEPYQHPPVLQKVSQPQALPSPSLHL